MAREDHLDPPVGVRCGQGFEFDRKRVGKAGLQKVGNSGSAEFVADNSALQSAAFNPKTKPLEVFRGNGGTTHRHGRALQGNGQEFGAGCCGEFVEEVALVDLGGRDSRQVDRDRWREEILVGDVEAEVEVSRGSVSVTALCRASLTHEDDFVNRAEGGVEGLVAGVRGYAGRGGGLGGAARRSDLAFSASEQATGQEHGRNRSPPGRKSEEEGGAAIAKAQHQSLLYLVIPRSRAC